MKTEFKDKINFSDVAHLYLGCPVEATTLVAFKSKLVASLHTNDFKDGIPLDSIQSMKAIPILRLLSDMTEEEIKEKQQFLKRCFLKGTNNAVDIDTPFLFSFLII